MGEMLGSIRINGVKYNLQRIRSNTRIGYATIKDRIITIRVPRLLDPYNAAVMYFELKHKAVRYVRKHPTAQQDSRKSVLTDGSEAVIIGTPFQVKVEICDGCRPEAILEPQTLRIKIRGDIKPAEEARLAEKLVSKAVLPMVKARVQYMNNTYFGARIEKVSLKSMRSRWGSYSKSMRSISLNSKLIFAPTEVLDYVIAHELAHSAVFDHSERFWVEVAKAVPEYKEHRKWLRKNGETLGTYSEH